MDDRTKPPGEKRHVLLGQIGAAHGIRGDVMVRTFTAEPQAIASYGPLTDKSGLKSYTLKIVRVTDKGVVARIAGVADRNGAEALRGIELYVARSSLPTTAEAEYYHADLVGLDAVTEDGAQFGRVVAVQNFGAGDLLEIDRVGGAGIEFIPFSKAHAPVVDLGARRVTIVPPVIVGDDKPAGPGDQG